MQVAVELQVDHALNLYLPVLVSDRHHARTLIHLSLSTHKFPLQQIRARG